MKTQHSRKNLSEKASVTMSLVAAIETHHIPMYLSISNPSTALYAGHLPPFLKSSVATGIGREIAETNGE